MRRLGVIAVSGWAVCLVIAGCSSTVGGTAVVGPGATTSATGKAHGLPALLLSLDEMKQLLKFDDLGVEDTVTQPDARGIYEPAGCVGAVFSSMAGSYDGSGYRDFYEVRLSDLTGEEARRTGSIRAPPRSTMARLQRISSPTRSPNGAGARAGS